jgi:TonB family protein
MVRVAPVLHVEAQVIPPNRGGIVSQRTRVVLSAALAIAMAGVSVRVQGQSDEIVRRAKTRVQPSYPELARKMNITGTVKVEVVVSPNGMVKDARVVGGHPVLANAALDAVKKWRFEPASMESTGVIDFKFEPR